MKQKINKKLLDYCYNNLKENFVYYINKLYVVSEELHSREVELYSYSDRNIIQHVLIKDKYLDFVDKNKYLYIINLYLLLRNFYERTK